MFREGAFLICHMQARFCSVHSGFCEVGMNKCTVKPSLVKYTQALKN